MTTLTRTSQLYPAISSYIDIAGNGDKLIHLAARAALLGGLVKKIMPFI
jgi:hypothetical protein